MAFLRLTGDWQLPFDVGLMGSGVFIPSADGNLGSLEGNDYKTTSVKFVSLRVIRVSLGFRRQLRQTQVKQCGFFLLISCHDCVTDFSQIYRK